MKNNFEQIITELKNKGIKLINELSIPKQIELLKAYYMQHPNKKMYSDKIETLFNAINSNKNNEYFNDIIEKQLKNDDAIEEINKRLKTQV